ncbi:MGH1-like glycoside hydrolase domain-containing protein [Rhabdothermincola sp.]|uniref:MGH1-like glycoside hydrolase domain-containing protein n=1 Tax=Rhabdothermincola sp. TaxID=2820405 RepID=UPI002FE0EE5C
MSPGDTLPAPGQLDRQARAVLERHWHVDGFCVPHASVYPHQWLWDSCFHAIVWCHLGEHQRAVTELRNVFRHQHDSGFVPHVQYGEDDRLADFWGCRATSSITQPPMYGHALAVLARAAGGAPGDLVERAAAAIGFLLDHRARDEASGLVTIVHPWESGADDSPRWDHWCGERFDRSRWYEVKGALLTTIVRDRHGAPLANPAFGAAPAGFNALVAFNALELAELTGDGRMRATALELAEVLARRWSGELATWIDGGPAEAGSGRIRTLDALLPLLVDPDRGQQVLDLMIDPARYGGPCGPAGMHRDETVFEPHTYWRGSSWPQLTYLSWVGAARLGSPARAALAQMLVLGATRSGFAEHWHPDTGAPLGAVPQSWSTLAAVVAADAERSG